MNESTAASKLAHLSTHYRSYLLRLWSTDQSGAANWQASLEDPGTGKCIGFANLEALFIFLIEQSEGSLTSRDDAGESVRQKFPNI